VGQAILTESSQVGQKGMQRMNSTTRVEDWTRETEREPHTVWNLELDPQIYMSVEKLNLPALPCGLPRMTTILRCWPAPVPLACMSPSATIPQRGAPHINLVSCIGAYQPSIREWPGVGPPIPPISRVSARPHPRPLHHQT
jgi:hypothetical protein